MGAGDAGHHSSKRWSNRGLQKRGNMKIAIALLALTFGAAIPLQTAAASDQDRATVLTKVPQNQDISAAKKRKRVYVYPYQYGYYYPPAFAPADPSWQSPELIRRRAIGQCVIDLGYGRYENCDGGRR